MIQNIKDKKIVIVIEYFPPDFAATGQLIDELTLNLSSKGYGINIITSKNNTENPNQNKTKENRKIFRIGFKRLNKNIKFSKHINSLLFCISFTLKLIFSKKNPDIICFTTAPPFQLIFSNIINYFKKIPFIIIIYDIYPDLISKLGYANKNNLFMKFWERLNILSYENAKEIIVLSDNMKNIINAKTKGLDKKITVLSSWVNNKEIYPIEKDKNKFIKSNNLTNKFIVIYSGNQGRCHDLETILKVAKLLKQEDEIIFLFIGNGAQHKFLKELKLKWSLKNCIFLPYQEKENLIFSLSSADIAIVSLKKEATNLVAPSKLYGHLGCGTPVCAISSNKSYLKKLIEEFELGKWFANNNYKDIANWIIFLKENPKTAKEIGLNCQNYLKKYASLDVISRKYEEILKKV